MKFNTPNKNKNIIFFDFAFFLNHNKITIIENKSRYFLMYSIAI